MLLFTSKPWAVSAGCRAIRPRLAVIFVLHLSGVKIHPSARRHDVADEDIAHAYEHTIRWVQLGDDPVRYLLVGPDRAGNLIELIALDTAGDTLIIHAMGLRKSTERELFGDED